MMQSRFVSLLLAFVVTADAVNLNLHPQQSVDEGKDKRQDRDLFISPAGNLEALRLIETTAENVVLGARDRVYYLPTAAFKPLRIIDWSPPGQVIEECHMKGKPEVDCHNFIRLVAPRRNGQIVVCGTHAFSPQCREYELNRADGSFTYQNSFNGRALAPYDPHDNFTFSFSRDSNDLFVATKSDFNSNDPLIYKKRFPTGETLRTQKDDLQVLDHPDFVGSFTFGDYLYVWFRERAFEATDRQVFSRVGRLCKNERGYQDRWSSFVKARLNCSIPADVPFYFNELQAVTDPIIRENGDASIYAIFSTSRSAVLMHAVCEFRMSTVDAVFDQGRFRIHQPRAAVKNFAQRQHASRVISKPGKCVDDSRRLGDLPVVLKNPLVVDAVLATQEPLIVEGPSKPELSAVVARVAATATERNQTVDVVFIGRDDGHVLKVVRLPVGPSVIVEDIRVFDEAVISLSLIPGADEVVVVGRSRVARIAAYHCRQQISCSRCVALRDPHCAWDPEALSCVHSADWKHGSFVQNVFKGTSSQCPDSEEGFAVAGDFDATVTDLPADYLGSHHVEEATSTAATVAMFIIGAIVFATALGILIGYRISKWRFLTDIQAGDRSTSSGDSDYDSYGRARLTRHDSLTTTSKVANDLYSMNPKISDAVSLVLSQHMPVLTSMSNGGSGYATPHRRLEHTAMLIPNGSLGNGGGGNGSAGSGSVVSHAPSCTLPRDYKVKKVYL